MPQCDNTCINNEGSSAMIKCCNRNGFKAGGCPNGRTVFCTNGISNNCPPQRTPQCDIICKENRGSSAMIDCCKANGFQSGGCPDGKSVSCTFN
uniref:Uncharacterized protein n=1 Tax=Panagrolaimus sp. ES5 TaxID=591445 RepID=A0AC34G656_9BILA